MTEQHIVCSRCNCKFITDDEHIKNDLGYNRLGERLKTCAKCRDNSKQYNKRNAEKTTKHASTLN